MQSKGKLVLFLIVLALVGLLAAGTLHEPKLVQTPVEQSLDAGNFKN